MKGCFCVYISVGVKDLFIYSLVLSLVRRLTEDGGRVFICSQDGVDGQMG